MSIIWVNGKQLADKLGITKGRVSQLAKQGVFNRGLNKLFDLERCTKDFKEKRTNAPRHDQKNALLPLDTPAVETKEDRIAEFKESVKKSTAGSTTYEFMLKSKAKAAYYEAERKKKLYEETDRELARKSPLYAAMRDFNLKNNAAIKAVLISLPKRMALGCPDPRLRATMETLANEHVRTALQLLSVISPAELDAAAYGVK